jgi:hypothetical protein
VHEKKKGKERKKIAKMADSTYFPSYLPLLTLGI